MPFINKLKSIASDLLYQQRQNFKSKNTDDGNDEWLFECYRSVILEYLESEYAVSKIHIERVLIPKCSNDINHRILNKVLNSLEKEHIIKFCSNCKKYFYVWRNS